MPSCWCKSHSFSAGTTKPSAILLCRHDRAIIAHFTPGPVGSSPSCVASKTQNGDSVSLFMPPSCLLGCSKTFFSLLIQRSSCCAPSAHLSCHHGTCTKAHVTRVVHKHWAFLGNPTRKPYWSAKNLSNPTITTYLVLLLCVHIQPNPGPRRSRGSQATRDSHAIPLHPIYPCGYCQDHIGWETPGICCGNRDIWFHADCVDTDSQEYSLLGHESQTWNFYKCNTNNDSRIYQSYNVDTHNSYAILFILNNDDVFVNLSLPAPSSSLEPAASPQGLLRDRWVSIQTPPRRGSPAPSGATFILTTHSSPGTHRVFSSSRYSTTMSSIPSSISALSSSAYTPNSGVSPTRSLPLSGVSADSVSSNSDHATGSPIPRKLNNLRTLVANVNSIRGMAAELQNIVCTTIPDIFTPPGYKGFRKDRNRHGGGVMIMLRDFLVAEEVEISDCLCEAIWVKIQLYVSSVYRTPSDNTTDQIDQFAKSLEHVESLSKNNPGSTIYVGGDFNAGGIDWTNLSAPVGSNHKNICLRLLEILGQFFLTQMNQEPTRESAILDLFLTNKPGLVKSCAVKPGLSDHDNVLTDCNVRAVSVEKPPRVIFKWGKADWDKIRSSLNNFKDRFFAICYHRTVEENYNDLNSFITKVMDENIPTKLSETTQSAPWFDYKLKRMRKRKQRLFSAAKKSRKRAAWERYRAHKRDTLKALQRARWSYLNEVLSLSLAEGDCKPLGQYIRFQKQDNLGISALKEKGKLISDATSKAEILSRQFSSVFIKNEGEDTAKLAGPNYPLIDQLTFNQEGVQKLLVGLNASNAAGPDHLPCRFLKEMAPKLAPILISIFNQSLSCSTVPTLWTEAFIALVVKKGARCMPENYRPVSLTRVSCKILEHIIVRHFRTHLERHGILTPFNHRFRSKLSWETQLLLTLQDLLTFRDRKIQIDMAILDFSKASMAYKALYWNGLPPSWRPDLNQCLWKGNIPSRLMFCLGSPKATS